MQLGASNFPVSCNQASRNAFVSAVTSMAFSIYKGNRVKIPCALFTGPPSADTFVSDISNLTGANLIIRAGSVTGPVLLQKTLGAGALNGALTYDQWRLGTGAHFEFDLYDTDTNQPAGAIYVAIDVVTSDSGNITVATANNASIVDDGIGEAGMPTAVDYTSYSKQESDARFVTAASVPVWHPELTGAAGGGGGTDLSGLDVAALDVYSAVTIREYATNAGVGVTGWVLELVQDSPGPARECPALSSVSFNNPRVWRNRF